MSAQGLALTDNWLWPFYNEFACSPYTCRGFLPQSKYMQFKKLVTFKGSTHLNMCEWGFTLPLAQSVLA